MKAIRLQRVGGAESLRCEEAQKPVPKHDQVLVRVHAAAVTPTELLWYPTFHTTEGGPRDFPIIPGHESRGWSKRSERRAQEYKSANRCMA